MIKVTLDEQETTALVHLCRALLDWIGNFSKAKKKRNFSKFFLKFIQHRERQKSKKALRDRPVSRHSALVESFS
jgi:hypothetical protein